MIIIPIGVDCVPSIKMIKNNLRKMALPFDWNVVYNGIHKIIENDFEGFIPEIDETTELKTVKSLNEKYDIFFMHHFSHLDYDADVLKYNRRIDRFSDLLKTSQDEIVFLRKGHGIWNHTEHNGKYNNLENEVENTNKLEKCLKEKYPELNFSIVLILQCALCFDCNTSYESTRTQIYNCCLEKPDDWHSREHFDMTTRLFEETFDKHFSQK
jgi:hypothetical protein